MSKNKILPPTSLIQPSGQSERPSASDPYRGVGQDRTLRTPLTVRIRTISDADGHSDANSLGTETYTSDVIMLRGMSKTCICGSGFKARKNNDYSVITAR